MVDPTGADACVAVVVAELVAIAVGEEVRIAFSRLLLASVEDISRLPVTGTNVYIQGGL